MGFEIPQLKTCCCGCTLRTGTKIIGWLSLIGSILMVISFGVVLAALFYLDDHPSQDPEQDKKLREHAPALKVFTSVLLIAYIFHGIVSFILLLGAYQNKARLLYIWVVVALTFTVIEVITNILQLFFVYENTFFSNLISFCISMYFILVVYSFYREVKNVSNNYA